MNAHMLHRLTSSLYNTPHLITAEAFDPILNYLAARNVEGNFGLVQDEDVDGESYTSVVGTLGVMNVSGALTYKPVMTACGKAGMSYQDILHGTESMIDKGVKTIAYKIDSPGGQAAHVFEMAEEVRAMADESGVKLIGYSDLQMTSAAYAFGVVCDVLIANASAKVGSIGCVVALHDTSEMMGKMGVKPIYITSGKNKVPFNEDGKFKKEFLDSLQEDVNALNLEFAQHVSKHRGIGLEEIVSLEAASFYADKALSYKLVDAVMTDKQFEQYVAAVHKGSFNG